MIFQVCLDGSRLGFVALQRLQHDSVTLRKLYRDFVIESEPCRASEARQSLPSRALFLLAQGPPPPQPQPPAPSPKPTSGSKRDGSRISVHGSERSWLLGHSRSLRRSRDSQGDTWDALEGTEQVPRRPAGIGKAGLEQS